MHTRASNSELVKPLAQPERTLNRRLCRRDMRVPFERRDERPAQPRIVYLPNFDINYFRHFLNILENYNPMDDEPIWVADRVVALTPGFAITIPETANEFAIKSNHLTLVKGNRFDGSNNSDTDKTMARIDAMTMKMDAQYKDFQSRSKCNHYGGNHSTTNCNDDDTPMSHKEEAKFMQTFRRIRFYNDYRDRDSNHDNWRSSRRNGYNRDNYRSNYDDKPDLERQLREFINSQQSTNSFVKETFIDLKTKLKTTTKNIKPQLKI
ncbi:hypothetical protein Tco_1203318 [Tanacetum coccineum]